MDDELTTEQLRAAFDHLAEACSDEPGLAVAFRRLAAHLPDTRPALRNAIALRLPRRPTGIRSLLWRALDAGLLDGHRFDVAMLARGRAERKLSKRYSPPPPADGTSVVSPSDSLSSLPGPG